MTDCQFRSLKFGVVPQMLVAPFGSVPSIITSVHSPWQRMASARQFASRIAKSLDENGVILHSPIRIDQPFCSFITLKLIMARHQTWLWKTNRPSPWPKTNLGQHCFTESEKS